MDWVQRVSAAKMSRSLNQNNEDLQSGVNQKEGSITKDEESVEKTQEGVSDICVCLKGREVIDMNPKCFS